MRSFHQNIFKTEIDEKHCYNTNGYFRFERGEDYEKMR